MKISSNNLKYSSLLFLLFLSQLAQAQPEFGDGDVQDVPQASIDNWVLPVMLIVIIFMFVYFYNKQKRAVQ